MYLIYEFNFGSHLYGTNVPGSDSDIRGILLPTISESLALTRNEDARSLIPQRHPGADEVYYPLHKFAKLVLGNNPSILEWLFIPTQHVLHKDKIIDDLLEYRKRFLARSLYFKFKCYAQGEHDKKLTATSGECGDKRRKEVQEFGYSLKSAINMLRLLDEGTELLTKETVTFPVPSAEFFRDIRLGNVKLDVVEDEYQKALTRIDLAYDESCLPNEPDKELMNQLVINMIKHGPTSLWPEQI